jgi:hypothetical protein
MDHPDDNGPAPELPRGAYSRIARRLRPKVTPQAVRLVYLGNSTSARISAAIDTYRRSLPPDHPAYLPPADAKPAPQAA